MARPPSIWLIVFFVGLVTPLFSRWAQPPVLPAERLLKNTRAYIQVHPEDGEGYYTLARIEYLCFANRSLGVRAWESRMEGEKRIWLPDAEPYWLSSLHLARIKWPTVSEEATSRTLAAWGVLSEGEIPKERQKEFSDGRDAVAKQLSAANWEPKPLEVEVAVGFAADACDRFERAIEIESSNPKYFLGRASLGRQWLEFRRSLLGKPALGIPSRLDSIDMSRILGDLNRAYDLAFSKDLANDSQPVRLINEWVSYEAGTEYVELVESMTDPSHDVTSRLAVIREGLARLNRILRTRITPIVLTLDPDSSTLSDLLAPALAATFDLDGDGGAERWPWVKPTTAFLVWDPDGNGEITSGRQLFGNASWWLLFSDGYRALDSLDDDRDGALEGDELRGIGAWFDRNSNGRSEPGEVVPVESLGIARIATRATAREGRTLFNPEGARLADGHRIATYDWVAAPVR